MRPGDAERAEAAHYRMQAALYQPRRRDVDGASFLWSEDVSEPDWNHAALVRVEPGEVDGLVGRVEKFFPGVRRRPAIAVNPFSRPPDLADRLLERGWRRVFRHSWLFAEAETLPGLPPGVRIEPVSDADGMDTFCALFRAGFEVPDALAGGIETALRRSFAVPHPGVGVVHYLATVDGEPAGVGSVLSADGAAGLYAGLYNLAVPAPFRCRGLGAAITRHRIADARDRGAEIVFLQTEEREVERWQVKNGLTPGFVMEGYGP